MQRFTTLFFVFFFGVFAATATAPSTAFAQAKSLEDLMEEVDEELEEDEGTQAEEEADSDEAGGVKSLEEMMGEVDEESDLEPPGVEETGAETEPAPAEVPSAAQPSPQDEGMPTTFWVGLIGLIVVLILLGAPLYVLIGSLALYLLFVGGVFTRFSLLTAVIEQTRGLADQPVLLAIPFFVISGALMTEGDIARRLIAFANSIFGWLPGGLAIATVFACVFFAAISGSSPVTVIAIGSIMYPALMKRDYPDRFSSGLVTSAGSLGILIPPSIPMIVYAIVDPTGMKDPIGYSLASAGGGDSSVKDLFIAGLGPGFLIGLTLALYAMYIGYTRKVETTPFDKGDVWKSFKNGFWALNLPVIILGGIYSGIFTPTQAAAVSVVYAAVVEFFIHRSLKLPDIPRIFSESAILMGSLLIIMALALGFNLYLDRAKIPEKAVEMMLDLDLSIIGFLLIVNILLIIVGFFMDILSAILILVPLLAPIGFGLGIHPLHLAVIFIVNLEIGYLTPPIGLNLFVASTLFKKGIGEIVRAVLPFTGLMVICLLLVTYVPTISLGLVSLSKGGDFIVGFPEEPVRKAADVPEKAEEAPPYPDEELEEPVEDDPPAGVRSLDELMGEVEEEEADEEAETDAEPDAGSGLSPPPPD